MADANGSAIPTETSATEPVSDVKGKGKAIDPTPAHDSAMDMDDDDSSEESGNEEAEDDADEDEEDDGNVIDTENIVGSRTRGKQIDYAAAEQEAKNAGDQLADEDEDDDDDFEDEDAHNPDAMEE